MLTFSINTPTVVDTNPNREDTMNNPKPKDDRAAVAVCYAVLIFAALYMLAQVIRWAVCFA